LDRPTNTPRAYALFAHYFTCSKDNLAAAHFGHELAAQGIAALAESRGRVSGPSAAAAKLGIPPSTLDHRIKALRIHKEQFKFR
jgi:transcriptional regulator of acetoin/glycerol metabolism